MEAAVDRRIFQPRISLDALVELTREGSSGFSANALDVGLGGMSMRAPHLPEVGSDVVCRFRTKDGTDVETSATVVWAKESGPGAEFGLRFHRLEGDAQRHLRKLVTGTYVPPAPNAPYRPKAPKDVLPSSEVPKERVSERELGRKVRLQLEGVDRSLTARLRHEGSARMELEQELPFLRLKTGLTLEEDGRVGRIESVDLLIEDDVPRLLIDVSYVESWVGEDSPSQTDVEQLAPSDESTLPDTPRAEMLSESTLAGFPPMLAPDVSVPELEVVALGGAPMRLTSKKPSAKALAVRDYASVEKPAKQDEAAPRVVEARVSAKVDTAAAGPAADSNTEELPAQAQQIAENNAPVAKRETAEVHTLAQSPEVRAEPAADSDSDVTSSDASASAADTASSDPVQLKLGGLQAALDKGLTAITQGSRSMAKALGPKSAVAISAVKTHSARLLVLVKPFLLTAWTRMRSLSATCVTFVRLQGKAGLKKLSTRRRKTSPAPRDSNIAQSKRKSRTSTKKGRGPQRERKKIGRWVLAAVLILMALILGKMAFFGDESASADDASVDPVLAVTGAPVEEPVLAANAPPSQPSQPVSVQLPQRVELPTSATPTPTAQNAASALGEPSREAGPMAAPTFPTIGANEGPQAPGTVPASSPYAAGAPSAAAPSATNTATPGAGGQVFGAASVNNGASFTLRMSRPVTEIRGAALPDGFTVTIPDSLSLDRAGPIAHSHPLVDRAMILNLGDHAVLTVHFVEGRSPDYRVLVRNNAIEVVVGR